MRQIFNTIPYLDQKLNFNELHFSRWVSKIPRSSNTNITFGQFLDRFPAAVGKGKLHYRFKSDDSSCGFLWQDMNDRNEIVPTSSGVMTCKILCLDNAIARKRLSRLRLKSNLSRGEEGAAVAMAKKLPRERKVDVHTNGEKQNSRNDNGTGKQSVRTPSRYKDHDDSNENVEEDSNEEDNDNYQQAPVQNNSKNSNNISHNGNGKTQDNGKVTQANKNMTATVNNLLDNDDATSPRTNVNTTTPPRKSRPSIPATAISKPPAAVSTSTTNQFISPSSASVSTPVSPPLVEQEQDMFHFEGEVQSCFNFEC